MSAGLPCVVSDVGGNQELIEHGKNGFLYKLNEESMLPEYIKELINDRKLREQMGANNQLKARKTFSVEQMASQYINQYQTMCKSISSSV
jgi:glycosyltransferase involved in cell wall biosynthesis